MKNLTRFAARLLAISVLLAPFAVGHATTNEGGGAGYALTGEVLDLQKRHINVGDVMLRLSPTVKVVKPGKPKATLSDIKPGDNIGVKMIKYRGKVFVDTIFYLTGSGATAN